MNDQPHDNSAVLPPPSSPLRRIAARLRRHGPLWLYRRGIEEIRSPLTPPGRWANAALRRARRLRGDLFERRAGYGPKDTLLAIYDLLAEPMTYDVIWFLIAADRQRRCLGFAGLQVLFVGGARDDIRHGADGYRSVIIDSAWRDRIGNILMPLAWALPNVTGVEVTHDRAAARARLAGWPSQAVFPRDYDVDLRHPLLETWIRDAITDRSSQPVPFFRASQAARDYIARWLGAHGATGRAVSITLRYYGYMPARNSNIEDWARFARHLAERGYAPLFVPDTDGLAEGVPPGIGDFPCLMEAAWNVNLRLALYESCIVNLGINNGPATLFLADDLARGLMFKMVTPGVPQAELSLLRRRGFDVGSQLPFCGPLRKCVWEDDAFDVIKREFDAMEALIRADALQQGKRAGGP